MPVIKCISDHVYLKHYKIKEALDWVIYFLVWGLFIFCPTSYQLKLGDGCKRRRMRISLELFTVHYLRFTNELLEN